jgi:hypothetical protein
MSLVRHSGLRVFIISIAASGALLGGAAEALLGVCGPFADVSDASFCPFVLEIFTLGITTGTTPTTYDPTGTVNRLQMAAFLSRTVDRTLQRGSRRAALNQFWRTEANSGLALTTVGAGPFSVVSDGEDLWVSSGGSFTISRVHGSDGKLLQTWTSSENVGGVLSAIGRIFVAGETAKLYRIDPREPAGAVTAVATNLGVFPLGIAYDGSRIWTSNVGGSVSIVTPAATIPWTVTTVATGFFSPAGVLYDGANIWVTNETTGTLVKLDGAGAILQTVTLGGKPETPIFDGSNIWVPNRITTSISVVRASNGLVLATLTGNGLNTPYVAAFDGQRILVPNPAGDSVSLWKAADLTPLGFFGTGAGTQPFGACSDGVNFWITLGNTAQLARF